MKKYSDTIKNRYVKELHVEIDNLFRNAKAEQPFLFDCPAFNDSRCRSIFYKCAKFYKMKVRIEKISYFDGWKGELFVSLKITKLNK